MDKKKIAKIAVAFLLIVVLVGIIIFCLKKSENVEDEIEDVTSSASDFEDYNFDYDTENAVYVTLSGDSATSSSLAVTITDDEVLLTKEGVYVFSGDYTGNIVVNSEKNIRIVLENVTLTPKENSAIYVENAQKVIITASENTTNTITDTTNYSSDEMQAAIYSKDDLVINGLGTINVNGNYLDGVVGKDDVKIIKTTLEVTAQNNAIKGKDSLEIDSANITTQAGNDSLKATNSEDSSKGYIKITGGVFNLSSEHDGIQAESSLEIQSGTFTITSGGGSQNSSKIGTSSVSNGFMDRYKYDSSETEETTDSYKGIKAGSSISITGGTLDIDSADDTIHSNGTIEISNASITASSGDDGVHADTLLTVDSGTISISKSYEGLESAQITINGGDIDVVSSDDGINVNGGNDSSSMNGRPGQNTFSSSSSSNTKLTVNDGNIYINATGDGIDSNGSIYINGGTVVVDGPTDGANGAIDYESECVMSGGSLIAVGSSQMAQAISQSSSVYCINATISTQQAGTTITLTDDAGNEIISHTAAKQYQSVVIATSDLQKSQTYSLNIDGTQKASVTISSVVTNSGSSSNNMQNNGMGGQNGRR